MADLKNERGEPVNLTDGMGQPVVLTDEHGNPMYITGVVKSSSTAEHTDTAAELHRSTNSSSSSSSSEDDGQGGRRKKKKGIGQKIKEKLAGSGKHKDDEDNAAETQPSDTAAPIHPATGGHYEHHEKEKKSVMEKIKDKLPGHHTTTHNTT